MKEKVIKITKDQLEQALIDVGDNKETLAKHFGCGTWAIRARLKEYGLNVDKRSIAHNKIAPPPREDLEKLYMIDNLNMSEIGEIYNVSNVTAMKWFVNYGIEVLSHSDNVRKKAIPKAMKTNLERYGSEYYFSSDEGKATVAQSFMDKHGVPYNIHNGVNGSKDEDEVLAYVNSLVGGFEKSYHLGIELDMYNDELQIAIEYCGLYWHTETNKGKDAHYKKYKICNDNGVRLITIFSDEWKNKQPQVKGFIRSLLKKNEIRIGARTLRIEKHDANNARAALFLEKHHIQGRPSTMHTICHYSLIDEDGHIQCIMSVGKHHRGTGDIVINRFCVKDNVTVSGGASKLFKQILTDFPSDVIKSWSDNRWSNGDLYATLGFEIREHLPKDYSYVKGGSRKSKQNMTKKRMEATRTQTEYERAQELGYDRIWDCGKIAWVYDKHINKGVA